MTDRELSRLLSLIALVALALLVPTLALEATREGSPPLWWQLPQTGAYAAVIVLFVRTALTGKSPVPAARGLWFITALAAATLPLAFAPGDPAEPMVNRVIPTTIGACTIGWRGWTALAPATALTALHAIARIADGSVPVSKVAEDAGFLLVLAVVAVAAVGSVRTSTLRLENVRRSATRTVLDAERAQSQARERTRWLGVVHDDVLAPLATIRAGQAPEASGQAAAIRALSSLFDTAPRPTWTGSDLADRVRDAARNASPGALVTSELDHTSAAREVPGDVASAIVAATTECVRNVVRHAGTDGRCYVVLQVTPELIEVVVTDKGVGIAPPYLRAGRLGMRVAVRDQMTSVGGEARWTSLPGLGTTVVLTWHAEADR